MARLHVLREGRGPVLLLLHGIGSSATAWTKQMERLGGEFACVAADLPGYGDSPGPSGEGLAPIVADVAELLEGRPAHVVGVSFGALTALGLARARPDLVRSLVLSDATLGRAHFPAAERERWLQGRERLGMELASRSLERARELAAPNAGAEVIEEIARHMRRARPEGYLAVARAIARTDARPWLAGLGQPTLIVCGEDDRVTGLDVSRTLHEGLPHAELLMIADAGHAPHIEQPDRFAEGLRDFLRRVKGPA
ncbi:MAG: alpha/beta fold hydrolase [Caldimonas sp.]